MKSYLGFILVALGSMIAVNVLAQTETKVDVLKSAAAKQAVKEKDTYNRLVKLAKEKKWPLSIKTKSGLIALLVDVDALGYPQYLVTENNTTAAATIGTSRLWPGGGAGFNLDASPAILKDKLAVWDGGKVRNTHNELNGRVVQRDGSPTISDHSTHVAGTLVASGVNPLARGMSYGLQELVAYDFGSHLSEMFNESPNLLVSNHSYGAIAGWFFNETENRWEFYGQANANEDFKFGYYSTDAQTWDSIAYNAPFYLIVKSAGNNRNSNGPAVGSPYWRFDANNNMVNAGNRPAGISDNNSYDIIPTYGVSKNVLTIGAVNPIAAGYTKSSDVVISSFSSWGPSDDGRIKPDVVADGVNLLSSIGTSDNSYALFSGTSMASPSAAGSVFLLQQQYQQMHNAFMRSATLKGIIIHTADEAGPTPGPDYQFGWGLINMGKAANVIASNNTDKIIHENVLNNAGTFNLPVVASGKGPLVVTVCWTDVKGTVEPAATALNNPTKKLVNDLDAAVTKGATTYRPWLLNPGNPAAAATTGDNITDNVEKIVIEDAIPGETYTIRVTHKNTLERGLQAYSLIASGVGGTAYCASAPTSTAGARIDSVSFANLRNKNVAGCTGYSSFTNLTGNIEGGQTIPIYVRLNSCDATAVDKIVKVFIDYNNDGDFTDAGENVATSAVINGDGVFTANVVTSSSLITDNNTIMRIVMVETNSAAAVTPCGTYTRGETQDYRIHINSSSTDVGITEIITPMNGSCAISKQYITVRLKNFGNSDKTNVPVTAVVKEGATTIATLNETFPGTITALGTAQYTFQVPFTANAGNTYTISGTTSLGGDQITANNLTEIVVTVPPATAPPSGTAEICGAGLAYLKANPTGSDVFTWYDSPAATTPIASGNLTSTTIIPGSLTYYIAKNESNMHLGPANKLVYTDGGYNAFNGNFVKFTNTAPVTIETVKLYIGAPGTITFIVADISNFNTTTGSYNYLPISSVTIPVYATAPTPPVINTQNNDPADLGTYFYLGLPVPTPGDHAIIVMCQNGANIFRNNNLPANPYPYKMMPDVMSITGNSAINTNDPNDVNFYQRFWYFFYDMGIRVSGCPSAKAPVVATNAIAPVISVSGNVFTSTIANGNQWYINGVLQPGATGQNFSAMSSGNVTSVVTDSYGCSLTSNTVNFVLTATPDVTGNQTNIIVSPNPSNGEFILKFVTQRKANLDIAVLNMLGQEVYHTVIPNFTGSLTKEIKPKNVQSGVYYLRLNFGNEVYIRKLVIK